MEQIGVMFGKVARRARRSSEMTQGQLSVRTGLTKSLISKIETGKREHLQLSTAVKIMCVLNIAYDPEIGAFIVMPPIKSKRYTSLGYP